MPEPASPAELSVLRADDRLESWKEIAVYLSRDERTVRRWEKQEGLPVHRHVHQKQASVYAHRSELDSWLQTRDVTTQNDQPSLASTGSMDWFRVVLGGMLWCVAYNVLTGAAWAVLLRRTGISSFHPLLGSSPPNFVRGASFLLLTLFMGFCGMWFYVNLRARYGARSRTAVYAGLALWWIWGVMPNLPDITMRTLPGWPLVFELTAKLVVITLATLAGAWVYRDPAPSVVRASSPRDSSLPT